MRLSLLSLLLMIGCPEAPGGFDRGAGEPPADDDDATGDDDATCLRGEEESCPAASCAELLQERPQLEPPGIWWLQPALAPLPSRTRCDADPGGGDAWTLALISADDGTDTWTWANRGLWTTDSSTVGSVSALDADFKSRLLHQLPVRDLAFRHLPSGLWIEYAGVGDGSSPLADLLLADEPPCWQPGEGHPPTGGDVEALEGGLCDPNLYLHAQDQDGDAGCAPAEPHRSDAWGPAWSAGGNDGCPFDDVGELTSLGPSVLEDPEIEYGAVPDGVSRGIGFGQALGLNSGAVGSGENRIELLIR